MGEAIGQMLPIAIAIAASPAPIAVAVLMLVSARPRANGLAFMAGWACLALAAWRGERS